jgi:hypothetical protein
MDMDPSFYCSPLYHDDNDNNGENNNDNETDTMIHDPPFSSDLFYYGKRFADDNGRRDYSHIYSYHHNDVTGITALRLAYGVVTSKKVREEDDIPNASSASPSNEQRRQQQQQQQRSTGVYIQTTGANNKSTTGGKKRALNHWTSTDDDDPATTKPRRRYNTAKSRKNSEAQSRKAVEMLDLATSKVIGTFVSVREAADHVKSVASNISECIAGRRRMCKNYFW